MTRRPPPPRKPAPPAKIAAGGFPLARPYTDAVRVVQLAAAGEKARGDELVAAALLLVQNELGDISIELRGLREQIRTFKGILVLHPYKKSEGSTDDDG